MKFRQRAGRGSFKIKRVAFDADQKTSKRYRSRREQRFSLSIDSDQKFNASLLFIFLSIAIIIYALPALVFLIIISIAFSILLDPIVSNLENREIKRATAISFVFLSLFCFAFLLLKIFSPNISTEIRSLQALIESNPIRADIENLITDWSRYVPLLNVQIARSQVIQQIEHTFLSLPQSAHSTWLALAWGYKPAFITALLSFFILKDKRKIKKSIITLAPNRSFEMCAILMYRVTIKIRRYLQSETIVASITTMLSILALYLLGIPSYLIFGIIIGVAFVIPYIGSAIGGAIAVMIGLLSIKSYAIVVTTIIALATIHLIKHALVKSLFSVYKIHLHPLVVIVGILAGGSLYGIWGMLLAIPFINAAKIFFEEVGWGMKNYNRDHY